MLTLLEGRGGRASDPGPPNELGCFCDRCIATRSECATVRDRRSLDPPIGVAVLRGYDGAPKVPPRDPEMGGHVVAGQAAHGRGEKEVR